MISPCIACSMLHVHAACCKCMQRVALAWRVLDAVMQFATTHLPCSAPAHRYISGLTVLCFMHAQVELGQIPQSIYDPFSVEDAPRTYADCAMC